MLSSALPRVKGPGLQPDGLISFRMVYAGAYPRESYGGADTLNGPEAEGLGVEKIRRYGVEFVSVHVLFAASAVNGNVH